LSGSTPLDLLKLVAEPQRHQKFKGVFKFTGVSLVALLSPLQFMQLRERGMINDSARKRAASIMGVGRSAGRLPFVSFSFAPEIPEQTSEPVFAAAAAMCARKSVCLSSRAENALSLSQQNLQNGPEIENKDCKNARESAGYQFENNVPDAQGLPPFQVVAI
jgi:hypothetical protein